MRRRAGWLVAALAGALGLATVAQADMVVRLKNGVEIRVPVSQDEVESISFDGKASAPAAKPEAKPAEAPKSKPVPVRSSEPSSAYAQGPIPMDDMKKAGSGPALPGASEFRNDAFARGDGPAGGGRTVSVGKGKQYERFGDVAGQLRNGDLVEIEGGLYINDFAVIKADNVVIRGVNGRPHFRASVQPPGGKAAWVVTGDNVVIENVEISGVQVPDTNGAAIRAEGGKLTVRNSYFHHNQFGLMSANREDQELTITGTEIAYNLRKDKFAHGLYIGHIRKFTLMNSYVHHNHRGHQVKTRARESLILYNRLTDEDGVGSYLIDAANCGQVAVVGNVLEKGAAAENYTAIAFGAEGCTGAGHRLEVINNTYVNDLGHGPMVKNHSGDVGMMMNNLVVGADLYQGDMNTKANIQTSKSVLVNPATFDYRLKPGAEAIDAGAAPGKMGGFDLTPTRQYVHPLKLAKRPAAGKLDVGAYEFTGK
jgi:hypothetical protein